MSASRTLATKSWRSELYSIAPMQVSSVRNGPLSPRLLAVHFYGIISSNCLTCCPLPLIIPQVHSNYIFICPNISWNIVVINSQNYPLSRNLIDTIFSAEHGGIPADTNACKTFPNRLCSTFSLMLSANSSTSMQNNRNQSRGRSMKSALQET